ncbi:MAG: cysteine desulfurase family protein [Candidatus Baltobacteraceae bacterium]
MTSRLYLDYAATTPVRGEVLEAMMPYFSRTGYNASSVHAEGRAAKKALDEARDVVASALNARPKEIVFTGGGSEADNLAIAGLARAHPHGRRRIVSSTIEHHAVLHTIDALREQGFETVLCPVHERGAVTAAAFQDALGEAPLLASVMAVNNELGTMQPIAELAALAHERGAFFHTDAVQAALYVPLDVKALAVDLLSLAAHKFYGPKGVGVLYVRDGVPLTALVRGGSQEFGKRAGTENVAGAVGLAFALQLAVREREESAARVSAVRDAFEAQVLAGIPSVRINGGAPRAPHISSLSLRGVDSEQLIVRLDLDGLAVSAGSACASGAIEPSHVIAALGLEPEWTRGVLRFSFGPGNTPGDAGRAADLLERTAAALRSISACF